MMKRTRILPWLGVVIVVIAETAPVLTDWNGKVVGPFGGLDARLQSGLLEWSRTMFASGDWISPGIFFPVSGALAFMDSLLGQAWLVAPLRGFGALTLAGQYNLAYVLSLALAGVAMTQLWRACGFRAREAGVAVIALVGSPYALAQLGHLNQLPMPFVLLAMATLIAILTRESPSRAWMRGAWWLLGGLLVAQAACGWYGFVYAVIAGIVIGALFLAGRIGRWQRADAETRVLIVRTVIGPAGWAIVPLALAGAGVLWLAGPYRSMAQQYPEFERSRAEVRYYGADLKHLVHGGAYRVRPADLTGRGPTGEARYAERDRQVLHFGWIASALALYGLLQRRRLTARQKRTGNWILAVGLVGFILAFGESIGLPGTTRRLPLPLEWLRMLVPSFKAFRIAWRFSFLAVISVAWWAAVGWRLLAVSGVGRARTAGVVAVLCALIVESVPYGLPAVELGFTGESRPLTAVDAGPLLTLPAPRTEFEEDTMEASWLLWSLETGRRVTGGVSGWVPPEIRAHRQELYACEQGTGDAAALIARLRSQGVAGAVIARRPGDDERIAFWRRRLTESGAARIPAGTRDAYEVYRWNASDDAPTPTSRRR